MKENKIHIRRKERENKRLMKIKYKCTGMKIPKQSETEIIIALAPPCRLIFKPVMSLEAVFNTENLFVEQRSTSQGIINWVETAAGRY